jgi:hypothetical protein
MGELQATQCFDRPLTFFKEVGVGECLESALEFLEPGDIEVLLAIDVVRLGTTTRRRLRYRGQTVPDNAWMTVDIQNASIDASFEHSLTDGSPN